MGRRQPVDQVHPRLVTFADHGDVLWLRQPLFEDG
jgi:hypothetical protein